MLSYSVFRCFPSQGLDSVIFLDFEKPLYSYIFKAEEEDPSFQLAALLCEINRTTIPRIPRPMAEDIILKYDALQAYQQTKTLVNSLLKASANESLQVAYRAARNNYINSVKALEKAPLFAVDHLRDEVLLSLEQKKKESEAIFKIVRQVYEQEHMLDECLPREFDGLSEETIDAIYRQEVLGE